MGWRACRAIYLNLLPLWGKNPDGTGDYPRPTHSKQDRAAPQPPAKPPTGQPRNATAHKTRGLERIKMFLSGAGQGLSTIDIAITAMCRTITAGG